MQDLNLVIAPGERVAVVVASGRGKTTLLRVLAGLTPASGGVQVRQASDAARVRVMFQQDRLLPWLGTLDNVTLCLPRSERHHAKAALAGVGLADRAHAYPHELSGGAVIEDLRLEDSRPRDRVALEPLRRLERQLR